MASLNKGVVMKKFSFVLLTLVFVLFVSAKPSYAAEENFFQRFSNSFRTRIERLYLNLLPGDKSAQTVLQQSFIANQSLQTTQVDGQVDVELIAQGSSTAKLKMDMSGPVEIKDVLDPSSVQEDLNLKGEVSMQGTVLRASADMKLLQKMMYFRLNELPALPYFNAASVTGKWYSVDKSETAQTPSELTPAQKEKMQAAYADLMKGAEFSPAHKDTKDGHAVFVIDMTIPKSVLKDYLTTVVQVTAETNSTVLKDKEKFATNLDKGLSQIGDVKATIWVDRGSYYIRHFEMPLVITVDKSEQNPSAEMAGNPLAALSQVDQVKVMVSFNMDKFNQPVTIDAPADAQPVSELSSQLMGSLKPPTSEGTSELPTLTPAQKKQLDQYKKMNPAQQQELQKMMQEQPPQLPPQPNQ